MSVEDYLNSIRKNTNSTIKKTSEVDATLKELLNYETLKRAIKDGVIKGNEKQFERLSELSKKILNSSDANNIELQEINQLLKLFYNQIPKNESGNTQVVLDSWIKALKEVLDEFGDKLPEKFQKRLKYDIVASASEGGANPRQVFQQLNQQQNIQVNQTLVLNNIYSLMKDQKQLTDRKAEAEKPIREQKEREQKTWWQNTMGRVTGFLGDIKSKLMGVGTLLGLIYVGMAVWNDLSNGIKNAIHSIFNVGATLREFISGGLISRIKNAFSKEPKQLSLFDQPKETALTRAMSKFQETKFGKTLNSWGKNIKAFSSKISKSAKAGMSLITGALRSVAGKFSPILKKFEPMAKFGKSLVGKLKPASAALGKLFPVFGKMGVMFKNLTSLSKIAMRTLGRWSVIGTAILAVWDFVQGFINTEGNVVQKILGGLKRTVTEFIGSFVELGKFAVNTLGSALKKIGWNTGGDALLKMGEGLDGLLNKMRSGMGYIKKDNTDAEAKISKFPTITEQATGTTYSGADAYNELMPLTSAAKGVTPTNAAGIRKASGVQLSSQTSDFIKRAGLTDTITSGVRKASNDRDWTGKKVGVGQISQRSHASGNKFDIGAAGKSAKQLAETLAKLAQTPGLVEAHVEGAGTKWRQTYLSAMAMLKKQGIDTSKIGWWGSAYASAPHIDVLIDPKYSGVAKTAQTPDFSTTVTSLADVGESKSTNPLVAQMTEQLTKAFNEQSKLFEKGAKAPDQLSSSQNKANTSAIVKNLKSGSSGKPITFSKKNDINDANLAALEILTAIG